MLSSKFEIEQRDHDAEAAVLSLSRSIAIRLNLALGVAVGLMLVGVGLFLRGFFLSKSDLPNVSSANDRPFPPLFPHLSPVELNLDKKSNAYFSSVQACKTGDEDNVKLSSDQASPSPLTLDHFLNKISVLLPNSAFQANSDGYGCSPSWLPVYPYDRVAVHLIDAMRFDFVLWDPTASECSKGNGAAAACESAPASTRPFYRNRMPFIHDLLRKSVSELELYLRNAVGESSARNFETSGNGGKGSDSRLAGARSGGALLETFEKSPARCSGDGNPFARLFVFEADPPTGTVQRVKGLTTGSMPSFFSVRESFSASPIDTDSLILQLKMAKRVSVALGDDVWESSFAHLLTRCQPFPSLNIRDIHTVDDKVKEHFPEEFKKGDWSLLLGHCLGVDHVGHSSQLDCDWLQKKLLEMNAMVRDTVKMILKDRLSDESAGVGKESLYLVLGDHGMTEGGTHGGASSEEVDAGLFAFSSLPAILSQRQATQLHSALPLFARSLPPYAANHGGALAALEDRKQPFVASSSAENENRLPQPPPAELCYSPRRVRQLDLTPTLSLLLGLPIPFNAIGGLAADLVPRVSSFVEECSGGRGTKAPVGDADVAKAVRCSDLAFLTQLHHIAAWSQLRSVTAYAVASGNDSVLRDAALQQRKAEWLALFEKLDGEVKRLPPEAFAPLQRGGQNRRPRRPAASRSLLEKPPLPDALAAEEAALLDGLGAAGKGHRNDEPEGKAPFISKLLPTLIPYLQACAAFSKEVVSASQRHLGTFSLNFMVCGVLLAWLGLCVLVATALTLRADAMDGGDVGFALQDKGLPGGTAVFKCLFASVSFAVAAKLVWTLKEEGLEPFVGLFKKGEAAAWLLDSPVLTTLALGPVAALYIWRAPLSQLQRRCSTSRISGAFRWSGQQSMFCRERIVKLFGGGRCAFWMSLMGFLIILFSDCFVREEASIIRFFLVLFVLLAAAEVFAIPLLIEERKKFLAAAAVFVFCVRASPVFEVEEGADSEAKNFTVDSWSASALCVFALYVLSTCRHLFLSKSFGQPPLQTHLQLEGSFSRAERFALGLLAFVTATWFAIPRDQNAVPQLSPSPGGSGGSNVEEPCLFWVVLSQVWKWIWLPFGALDNLARSAITHAVPDDSWVFPVSRQVAAHIPKTLLSGNSVNIVSVLHTCLPWLVYACTIGLWIRLSYRLCSWGGSASYFPLSADDPSAARESGLEGETSSSDLREERLFDARRPTAQARLYGHLSRVLFCIGVCPLFLLALLLGRKHVWPLLLCLLQWRLLFFLCGAFQADLANPSRKVGSEDRRCALCKACRETGAAKPDGEEEKQNCAGEPSSCCLSRQRVRYLFSTSAACMMVTLLAFHTFFATGHRMRLSAVPIAVGFVGLSDFHPQLSVVHSFLHTFLIFIMAVPFLLMIFFWRKAQTVWLQRHVGNTATAESGSSEHFNPFYALRVVGSVFSATCICVGLRLCTSVLSLTLLRNHLFIWEIFAVKFLYDSMLEFTVMILLWISAAIVTFGVLRHSKNYWPSY